MLRFPLTLSSAGLPLPKMTLRDYARFSEQCLRSNPAITPENCLAKRISEEIPKRPFSLRSAVDMGRLN